MNRLNFSFIVSERGVVGEGKEGRERGTAPFMSQTGWSKRGRWFVSAGDAVVAENKLEPGSGRVRDATLPSDAFVSVPIARAVHRSGCPLCGRKKGDAVVKYAL